MIGVIKSGRRYVVGRHFDLADIRLLARMISVITLGCFEFSGDGRVYAHDLMGLQEALPLARHHSVFETLQIQQDGPFAAQDSCTWRATVVQPENTMQPTVLLHPPAKIFPRGL